jgi:hypothetical protein
MFVVFFVVSVTLVISSVDVIPAPAVVYSGVIENEQDNSIECSVAWSSASDATIESDVFIIGKQHYYKINEKIVPMGTWKARATISRIQCDRLVLSAPFDLVDSPKDNWKFRVHSNKIESVGPCSRVG